MAKIKKQATNQRELNRLVNKWQKRLRLMDWNVTASFDTDGILEEAEAWGACNPQGFIREAVMLFRHPEEAKQKQTQFDLETIVVHELLHIFFAPYEHENYTELTVQEQMVHTLAILLVSLERQGKKAGRAKSFDELGTIVKSGLSCACYSVKKERYERVKHSGN